jgi:hypothetical protein
MKTTGTASIDEKIKALHELKAEQAKRQHAKIIAVMKDPGRTADDLGRAFRNSWFRWVSELGVEVIERRMRAGEAVEPAPTQPLPESSGPPPAEPGNQLETVFQLKGASASTAGCGVSPPAQPPAPSGGGGLCITFINKGTPIFYAYEPNGTITLTDHSGAAIKVGGKMFQAQLDRGENADEVAQALWRESRGEKHDHFDGPILYRDPPVY